MWRAFNRLSASSIFRQSMSPPSREPTISKHGVVGGIRLVPTCGATLTPAAAVCAWTRTGPATT
jgi:hypothetical protein